MLAFVSRLGKGLLILTCALGVACGPTERVILLEVSSPATLDSLEVTVVPTDHSLPLATTTRSLDRPRTSAETIAEPIPVAVRLMAAREVMVILRARSAEGSLFAQRCVRVEGVTRERVHLALVPGASDADADGFPGGGELGCQRWQEGRAVPCAADDPLRCRTPLADDCNDGDPRVHPASPDVCGNGIDEDCTGDDADCVDADGDGWDACASGQAPTTCDCADGRADVHPEAADPCRDGVDQDCDGIDDLCDRDCDGYAEDVDCYDPEPLSERAAGVAAHPNTPLADMLPRSDGDRRARGCDPAPMPRTSFDGCAALRGDGVDQDCNGFPDDGPGCENPNDRDGDGSAACGSTPVDPCDRDDCDPGIHPGATERCGNGIDEDSNGRDLGCDAADSDQDGFTRAQGDCDDANRDAYPGAPTDCSRVGTPGYPANPNCAVAVDCSADPDGDHYVGTDDCRPSDSAVHPGALERCDGADDDCDGRVDEFHGQEDYGCTRSGMVGLQVEFGATSTYSAHCGGCGVTTEPNQDCCTGVPTDVSRVERCGSCSGRCDANELCMLVDSEYAHDLRYDCACAAGWFDCEPSVAGCETDVETSARHCGACGRSCGPGEVCSSGMCTCATGRADCDSAAPGCETDTTTSVLHCGRCRTAADACAFPNAAATCRAGTCEQGACAAGFAECDSVVRGCETPTNQPTTCGGCVGSGGRNCTLLPNVARAGCTGTVCTIEACAAGFANCDGNVDNGCEVNTDASLDHCGGCRVPCRPSVGHPSALCDRGMCIDNDCMTGSLECDPARPVCETRTDLATSCGTACMAIANCTGRPNATAGACVMNACQITCAATHSDCNASRADGCETATGTTTACGSCTGTTNCVTEGSRLHRVVTGCTSGACGYGACEPGYADCDGLATNGCELRVDAVGACGCASTNCLEPNVGTATCTLSAGSYQCTSTSCDPGFGNCSSGVYGCPTSLTRPETCGTCATDCTAPSFHLVAPMCMSGRCAGACAPPYSDCDGMPGCERFNSVMSCGCARQDCSALANVIRVSCVAASSGYACSVDECESGFARCGSDLGCATDLSSAANCGACGVRCTGSQICGVTSTGWACMVPDAGIDAGRDAGRDAGEDAGRDAGEDAGRDAGEDAGRDDDAPVTPPDAPDAAGPPEDAPSPDARD